MISRQDIICISSIEWDFLWQGHQEITKRLADAGNRVLYVENTGVRAPGIKDASRVWARLRHWTRSLGSSGVREVASNVYVCSPLILPPFGSSWRRELNRRILLPAIRRAARRLGMRGDVIWTYLPTDTALDLINQLRTPHSVVVYYCVDNFAQLTPHVSQLKQSEQAVLESSDVVFATHAALAANCERWSRNVHVFPFGVDLKAFPLEEKNAHSSLSNAARERLPESVLPELARPVIGYVGGLHRHIDFRMLAEMARARPLWSWVFVGAIQTELAELAALSNVHLPGQKRHEDLVRYIREFDVCIVPYMESLYTATVVPTKINEYLAVGKPVVSTKLPSVCEFNRRHNVLLTAAPQAGEFLQCIEEALRSPKDEAAIKRRREIAALGDWGATLVRMSDLIETQVRAKRRAAA